MKGTIFAVALNHRSQLDAWQEAFQQSPYKAPPKTAVWFIKPRNTVIGCGEPIPFPQGEKVLSGATVALIVGKTATKVGEEDAAEYIAGYALANDVSLPEESFYRPAIKAKCRDGFCPIGETVALSNVDNLTIYTEINGRPADHWNTADLQRNAAQLLSALSEFATLNPGDAMDYVAGYTVCNDYAIRDYLENYYRPNLRVKSRDGLTPMLSTIVPKEAIPDPHNLTLRTFVNGELRQQGTTADLIFSVPFLIAYLSEFMTLNPGDMIATGTPKGLSDVVPGDEVVVEVEGVGRLVNRIVSEDTAK
ncbi:hypothetical protein E8L33_07655 [Escherichia coli]|nr:hypothetical protein [Escherichia coli]